MTKLDIKLKIANTLFLGIIAVCFIAITYVTYDLTYGDGALTVYTEG